jgi:Zn-dependent membrane protease YugP
MFVSLLFVAISMLVSYTLKSKFSSYTKDLLASGLTGKQVAEKMLKENGIFDVQVTSSEGFLSDHYNPLNKTVNLSPDVYNGSNVAAAAVAAHECGHAVQHATGYQWLTMRSRLVPHCPVQFWHYFLGIIGRNYPDQQFPPAIIGRNRTFCTYYLIFYYYFTGRV